MKIYETRMHKNKYLRARKLVFYCQELSASLPESEYSRISIKKGYALFIFLKKLAGNDQHLTKNVIFSQTKQFSWETHIFHVFLHFSVSSFKNYSTIPPSI